MKFGSFSLSEAQGAVLAHSIQVPGKKFKKGTRLGTSEIADLQAAGIDTVVAARFEAGDLTENVAAKAVADRLVCAEISASAPFTGRVNLFSERAGVLVVDEAAINALNSVDEAITLATLPSFTRVAAGTMIGTVKIIPYGVSEASVAAIPSAQALKIHPFALKTASLILTQTSALSEKVLNKGRAVIAKRIEDLELALVDQVVVPHATADIAAALNAAKGEMVLILGASATSDRADICPTGLIEAGGVLTRFGMPVDPGNLLFLGNLKGRPVVGLPGCARSPVLNGADWVLERLTAGLEITSDTIAGLGVGGLLKENPKRPQPRAAKPLPMRAKVGVILLAAGASRRMRGRDKLLEEIGNKPVIARLSADLLAAQAASVHVVTRPDDVARRDALKGMAVDHVIAKDWDLGMSASIRAGLAALSPDTDAAVIALADMPEITRDHINQLIAAFSPEDDREIIRAQTQDGKPGHPVLFGRRFFESLAGLSGDRGARELLRDMDEFTHLITLEGQAALTDLDTPEAWVAWRKANPTA